MIPRPALFARALIVVAAAVSACSAADLFVVAGTVVNAGTKSPLPHAYVQLYRSAVDKPAAGIVTGGDGRFSFQLPAGSYTLLAGTRDDQENYGARNPASSFGSAIIVGPGKDTSNIVFRFFPPAVIAGRVLDEAGEPARSALVQLVRSTVVSGRRAASVFAWKWTDDLGEYRFDHLAGGALYYLAVSGQPWYSRRNSPNSTGEHTAAAYAPVYYADSNDPAKATPLSPQPGEEIKADFRLSTVTNATVNVKYTAPPGMRGTVVLNNDGVAGTTATQQTQQLNVFAGMPREPDGISQQPPSAATFQSVPPGHYILEIEGTVGGTAFGASAPVDVNGSDITLSLSLTPSSKIEGKLHLPAGAVPKDPISVSIRDAATGETATVSAGNDRSFSFPSVQAGRFYVSAVSADGFFVTRLDSKEGTVKDGILEVPEHTTVNLSISLGDHTGKLTGFVIDGERPVEGVLVVLVSPPGDTAQPGNVYRGFQTESDGSFNFGAVPAGRYRIFAVDQPELEYAKPEAVEPYLSNAKAVVVRAGTPSEERIPLSLPSSH